MIGGWFIGDFVKSVIRTSDFEVAAKTHKKGEIWPRHTHKIATEINVLISGKMTIQGIELNAGDIFTIYPNEISDPIFLEDCFVIVVKIPSVIKDKYEI
jgi:quercetin dioxygenase-like cupin family protein